MAQARERGIGDVHFCPTGTVRPHDMDAMRRGNSTVPRRRSRRSRLRSVRIRVLAALGPAVFLAAGLWATSAAPSTRALLSPVSSASSSSRGVTKNGIAVVFPVVSLNSLAGREGFAEDAEYGEQTKAIKLFVKQVNQDGGIHGRRIDPIISGYDPTNETQMRSLCKTWTQGSPAAFAVLDGLGAWTGDNQLCVTQEGHTPLIGAWSTVSNWTNEGSPYLWWTGPDQATILQAVVNWGLGAHLIGGKIKVGVIAGSRASDQVALNRYLLPDLRTAGVDPIVKTIDADPNETATTGTQSPLVIQQLRRRRRDLGHPAHAVQRVLPGAPGRNGATVLPPAPPQRLRVEHPLVARAHPRALRQGPRRPGGSDHRDPGRDRRRPTPEPGRLRPRRAQVLDGLAQGLPAGASREHE